MSQSVSMVSDPDLSTQAKPAILNTIQYITVPSGNCSLHTQQQIDLLLLAVEALELGASEHMLATIKKLELEEVIKGRVHLWRLRSSNPWRRSFTRDCLSLDRAKALVIIAGDRAKKSMVLIRQLLLAEQQMKEKQLPLENHFRLSEYLERFRAHFRSRMNPRRTKVAAYLASEEELNELALSLLKKLLFCTGTRGIERVWFSLFDGELR